jgi:hypothetical protein
VDATTDTPNSDSGNDAGDARIDSRADGDAEAGSDADADGTTTDSAVDSDAKTDGDGGDGDVVVDVSDADSGPDSDGGGCPGVCTPGTTEPTGGSCTSVGDIAQHTCTASCTWGAETCVTPSGWRAMSASPLTGRWRHGAVWTGSQMIVWGGSDFSGATLYADGAKYDLASDTWTAIAAPPTGFVGRKDAAVVWTGAEMVVWGGTGSSGVLLDGAAYDPTANTWKTIAATPLGSSPRAFGYAATTNQVVIWAHTAGAPASDSATYDPTGDSWSLLPTSPLGNTRSDVSFAWTGLHLAVFGGQDATILNDGARCNAATRTWSALGTPPGGYVPRVYTGDGAVNGGLIVVGGLDGSGTSRADGIVFDASGTPDLVPAIPSSVLATPERLFFHTWCDAADHCWFWSGANVVGATRTILGGGASYSVSTKTWTPMTAVAEPAPRARGSVAWTNKSAIVWVGETATAILGDGAIFTP